MDASLAQRLYGTDEPPPVDRPLRAGPLTLRLRGDRLLRLCCDGHEVWHGLAFVLRDPDWGTPAPVVERCELEDFGDAFRVRLEGRFAVTPALRFVLRLAGGPDGSLQFDAEAVPDGELAVNRLGLCLMHPSRAAGAELVLRHVDGRESRSTLPTRIPPWPPFMGLRGVAHEWAPGCWGDAVLLGDSFEMEDQRNNADASFKTYSRSNLMPRPYRLPGGIVLRQSARLELRGRPARAAAGVPAGAAVAVAVGDLVDPGDGGAALPRIGVEIHAADTRAAAAHAEALRRLRPAHLHLALGVHAPCDTGGATADPADDRAVDVAGLASLLDAAGARLRLDLGPGAPPPGLAALAARVPTDVAVFPSDDAALAAARRAFPSARVGGGTPYYFAQLHRLDRLEGVDFVSFTVSPLVHGADDDAVMDGAASLPAMVQTLRARWPGAAVQVGPSTIGVRRSPLGGQPATDGRRRIALAARDPRCGAQFGAAWLLAQVAALAPCGVAALTLMSLGGASAVVRDGRPTPAGHLLARLGRGGRLRRVASADPSRVAALAFEQDGESVLLLANLTPSPLPVAWHGFEAARVEWLDAAGEGWRAAAPGAPPVLAAYAVARLAR